jgi:hypothetical protein
MIGDRNHCRALRNMIMNPRVPSNFGKVCSNLMAGGLEGRKEIHEFN